jgi:arginase
MLVKLLGAPVQDGAGRRGCDMGPASFRAAGLGESLTELGHHVTDLGDVSPAPLKNHQHSNPSVIPIRRSS